MRRWKGRRLRGWGVLVFVLGGGDGGEGEKEGERERRSERERRKKTKNECSKSYRTPAAPALALVSLLAFHRDGEGDKRAHRVGEREDESALASRRRESERKS